MGEYAEQQRIIRYYEKNKIDNALKLIEIKYLLGLPVLWIKTSRYKKIYSLFNKLPLLTIIDYRGIKNG